MKLFFRRIHLYLGLAAGLVITITCLTGAILVFQEELEHTFSKEKYYVAHTGQRLPVQQLVSGFEAHVKGAKTSSIRIYSDAERTVELTYKLKKGGREKKKPDAKGGKEKKKPEAKGGQENNYRAFIDPYTGAVLVHYSTKETFFYKVLAVHRWLLAEDTGKLIVGTSTLIFLFIIITGIVLWWPANKRILKQRLKIKSDAGWKRINHDWHLMTGFYSAIFLFIFAFTGLAWSFKWFNDGIYKVTNSPLKNPEPPVSLPGADSSATSLDGALTTVPVSDAVYYNINLPKGDSGSIAISVLRKNAAHETATDAYYIDQYSGKTNGRLLYAERSKGAKIRSAFKPIHTASIWGIPSKIIGFIACLLGAVLPTTGIIMWVNRAFKRRRNG